MSEWGVRSRLAISEHAPVLAVVLVVAIVLGGGVVYTSWVDPGTETTPEVQSSWESTGVYDHEATVTEDTRVFARGETLRDRERYFTGPTPELDGTFSYRYGGPGGDLDVTAATSLVLRAVEDDRELWRVEEPIGEEATSLAPGEEATVPFTVNVSEVLADLDEIESELGASPGDTEALVVTDLAATGSVGDVAVDREDAYVLTLEPGSDTYRVSSEAGTDPHEQVEQVTRPVEYGPLRLAAGPLLVLIGLGGLVGLAVGRRRGAFEVGEVERRSARFASERDEFDDWISRGSASEAAGDRPVVRIDDLEGLVDVAVDTDGRVVEDVAANRYYVLGESFCYEYRPPEAVDVARLAG